jgi:hypothetical protein
MIHVKRDNLILLWQEPAERAAHDALEGLHPLVRSFFGSRRASLLFLRSRNRCCGWDVRQGGCRSASPLIESRVAHDFVNDTVILQRPRRCPDIPTKYSEAAQAGWIDSCLVDQQLGKLRPILRQFLALLERLLCGDLLKPPAEPGCPHLLFDRILREEG